MDKVELRLTDSTWEALGAAAESLGITKADLLEQIFRRNDSSSPSNTRLDEVIQPSNTRLGNLNPCITWQQQEIERFMAEVQRLSEEKALLMQGFSILLKALSTLIHTNFVYSQKVVKVFKTGKQIDILAV